MTRVLVILMCLPVFAPALVVEPQSVLQQLESSELVADIRVVSLKTVHDPKWITRWQAQAEILSVHRSSKNWRRGERIRLTGIGGEHGDRGVLYDGLPKPYVKQSYRAYLKENDAGLYEITGFESGLVPLEGPSRQFSRNRTDGSDGLGSGPFLHWDPKFFPIPYAISLNTFTGSPEFVDAIVVSFSAWTALNDTIIDLVGIGCTTQDDNENDGVNSVIFVNDTWEFDSSVIAITRNFFVAGNAPDSGQILDSDILLNAVDHEFSTTEESDKHDVQNIVTHEIGHVLGLGHEVDPVDETATMFAVATVGETSKRELKASDIAGAQAGYTGTAEKVGQESIVCNVPEEAVGCFAVHGNRVGWGNGLFLWLSLVLGCLVARYFALRTGSY